MKPLLSVIGFLFVINSYSAEDKLTPIEVKAPKEEKNPAQKNNLSRVSSDTASLLEMTPGVSLQKGGGISSLPVIQGLADDRVNIKIDGANITSSCSNHMNPALSYIDPTKVKEIEVMAGITPVSFGGDSLAGSIVVESKHTDFSKSPDKLKQELNFKTFYKSNNENQGASVYYSVASEKSFATYSGFDESANNYRNGKGKRLKSTLYNQNNQSLTLGQKMADGVLALKLNHARVPYQGFINQYMDMTDNASTLYNLNYKGALGEVYLDSAIYYQHTNHLMDILQSERTGRMPMYTRSDELGYTVKASVDLSKVHVLTVGSDYNQYRLNDWWPALPGLTMMMGPETFESIRDGKRDRFGLFVENDSTWSSTFSTNIGLRTDIVSMDTGDVQGYNNTDNLPADAAFFNGQDHKQKDHNYDATFLSKIKITPTFDIGVGLARKTRSPNLYERYAWAGSLTDPTTGSMSSMSAGMDMRMINWFGDGNGYVGDINLNPEVAHKISSSFIFHDEEQKEWEVKLTPFYSDIQNFIDADFIGSSMGTNFLRFANHDAIVFGADLGIKARINEYFTLKAIASYTRGYRRDGKADLYHIMPLNGKIAFEYSLAKWKSEVVTHLVNKKEQVNELRAEPTTPGYALLDLGTSYQFSKLFKVDFAITNLLDHQYALPLGGVDLVNFDRASGTPVAGMGRSFNMALNLSFF